MATQLADLSVVKRTSVSDEIVRQLVSFMVSKGLKSGDKLPSERELRERLGVGRSSMREAIKVLSTVGALEVISGQGMFVGRGDVSVLTSPLFWALMVGEKDKLEVVEARRVIEVELTGLAAERASGADLTAIERTLIAMQSGHTGLEDYSRHDLEFHLAIAHAADNRVLAQMLETLRHVVHIWIYETFSPEAPPEHIPIYEAIRARDRDAARRAMAHHMDRAEARLVSHLSSVAGLSKSV